MSNFFLRVLSVIAVIFAIVEMASGRKALDLVAFGWALSLRADVNELKEAKAA